MHLKSTLPLITAALFTTTTASAVTLKLSYYGDTMPLITNIAPTGEVDPTPPQPGFRGSIILDEAAYGGRFRGKTVDFYYDWYGYLDGTRVSEYTDIDGIVSWNFSFPLYSVAGTRVRFTFGKTYEVLDWVLDAMDGPPDYGMSPRADGVIGYSDYYNSGYVLFQAPAKEWTVRQLPTLGTEIPLPASLPALGAGVAALGLLRRKRRRA